MMLINEKHTENFKAYYLAQASISQEAVGFNPSSWWRDVGAKLNSSIPVDIKKIPNRQVSRHFLKKMCADSSFSDAECAVAIMAWGVQKRQHGAILFNRFNDIAMIISKMRHGISTSLEAYEMFDHLWQHTGPLGMGAAYFTKLIFFCVPSHCGYIMDQWTGKSANLLASEGGKPIVHIKYNAVHKDNTVQNYVAFLNLVETLATHMNVTGEQVEIAMFSHGGHKKGRWRQYVINHS